MFRGPMDGPWSIKKIVMVYDSIFWPWIMAWTVGTNLIGLKNLNNDDDDDDENDDDNDDDGKDDGTNDDKEW